MLLLMNGITLPQILLGFAIGTPLVIVYLAPFLVAAFRQHHDLLLIFLLNVLLGWTLIGWIYALVLVATYDQRHHVGEDALPKATG